MEIAKIIDKVIWGVKLTPDEQRLYDSCTYKINVTVKQDGIYPED